MMINKLHQLQIKVGAIKKDSQNPLLFLQFSDINQLIATLKLFLEAEDDDANLTKPVAKPVLVNNQGEHMELSGKQAIAHDLQCSCGGSISVQKGISKKTNKPYIKQTCGACGKITWG